MLTASCVEVLIAGNLGGLAVIYIVVGALSALITRSCCSRGNCGLPDTLHVALRAVLSVVRRVLVRCGLLLDDRAAHKRPSGWGSDGSRGLSPFLRVSFCGS